MESEVVPKKGAGHRLLATTGMMRYIDNISMRHRLLTIFIILISACCGWAQSGPHAGTFSCVDSSGSAVVEYTITLTPAKGGDFTVSGTYTAGREKPQRITGILHRKTGHLNATVHDGSKHLMDQSFGVNGYWSTNDGTLVLQRSHNMVMKAVRKESADDWVCDGPTIEDKGTAHGSASGISATFTRDGQTGEGTITISGIPRRVRDGEHIKITLGASASPPARASAWINLGDIGQVLVKQDGVYTDGTPKPSGTCEIIFHGGSNAYIQVSGGMADVGWSLVTFKFHKAKS